MTAARTPLIIDRDAGAEAIEPLRDRTIAVLGYGNQGHAHALNLRDSGLRVIVGQRSPSRGWHRALADGFHPMSIEAATAQADLAIVALPDEAQPEVYRSAIEPNLRSGAALGFVHGFSIRYGLIQPRPDVSIIMVAPKGPGTTLRDRFSRGQGIPCLLAVERDVNGTAEQIARAWAVAIGCGRAGIIRTTFADETETDLFGEQAVLCGGMTQLILAAFETLVADGYSPELAYLECCHEVKQIADLVYARGLTGMMEAISNTAEFGAYRAGPLLVDEQLRSRLRELLRDVRNGTFAQALQGDHAAGFEWFRAQRDAMRSHPIEQAGRTVRALMPWLEQPQPPAAETSSAADHAPERDQ